MQGLKKRRRIQLLSLATIMLVLAASLAGYGFRDGISYFRLPSDLVVAPPDPKESFRLGGLVERGSLIRSGDAVSFVVTDDRDRIQVSYSGILPDLFAEGQGVVALGRYADGVFRAEEVLAKHDEKYMPAEVADALKDRGLFQHANEQE